MARGSCKTPPPHTHSRIVTRSYFENKFTSQIVTTSNKNPQITVELVTPNPQGSSIQEIVFQTLLRTHSALAYIRQLGQPLNQPLDFSDIKEKLEGTGLLLNPIDPDHTPTLGVGGSSIPPSPPHSSPSSLEGELPKAKVSEFILTVDSGGRMSEYLTLGKDFTPEVCVGEYFGTPEARSPEVNQNC
jgi:hypothetical protein